jgi:hypothetical protein
MPSDLDRCRTEIARCEVEIYSDSADPGDQQGAFRGWADWHAELAILEGLPIMIGGKEYGNGHRNG